MLCRTAEMHTNYEMIRQICCCWWWFAFHIAFFYIWTQWFCSLHLVVTWWFVSVSTGLSLFFSLFLCSSALHSLPQCFPPLFSPPSSHFSISPLTRLLSPLLVALPALIFYPFYHNYHNIHWNKENYSNQWPTIIILTCAALINHVY